MVPRTFHGRVCTIHWRRHKMVDYTCKSPIYLSSYKVWKGYRSIWKRLRGRRGDSGAVWRSFIRDSRLLDLRLLSAYSRDLVSMSRSHLDMSSKRETDLCRTLPTDGDCMLKVGKYLTLLLHYH